MSPLGEGPDFDGEYHTAGEADAAAVSTDAQRAALASQVRRQMPPDDDQWWQLWTGQRWEDLTPRPATSTMSSPGPDAAGQ
jgi:hypothetical protein